MRKVRAEEKVGAATFLAAARHSPVILTSLCVCEGFSVRLRGRLASARFTPAAASSHGESGTRNVTWFSKSSSAIEFRSQPPSSILKWLLLQSQLIFARW